MSYEWDEAPNPDESELSPAHSPGALDEQTQQSITKARSALYSMIARFRKDAANSEDGGAKSIFEFAAEVISGLTRALRQFQEERSAADKDTD